MKFTRANLLDVLRDINPEVFNNYVGQTNLSNLLDLMFIEGFRRTLVNGGDFRYVLQRKEQMDILLKADRQIESPGWFTFEEEEHESQRT